MSSRPRIVFLDAGSIREDFEWPDFSVVGDIQLYDFTRPADVIERAKEADIVLTNKVLLTASILDALPKLKYVGLVSTGYNQVDCAHAAQRGIYVCNVPGYSTTAVAQFTFALLLELCSKVGQHAQAVRDGEWSKSEQFCFWNDTLIELAGKTFGVVGFGDIGREVARLANAFGMSVIAYAPRPQSPPTYSPFAFVGLDTLFAEADVVSLHCPLTAENTGMVNKKLLGTMKKTAYLLNTARGPLIHEVDLAEALHHGTIAGAALDVVAREPMAEDNPLRLAPHCIITPHIAWATVDSRKRLMEGVLSNIQQYLSGTPQNVVNGLHA